MDHCIAVKQFLCYLKFTPRYEILYKDLGHTRFECILYVDWVGSLEYIRSSFEYCVFLVG